MKVSLINYTPYPLETLLFTKNTRLNMNLSTFSDIVSWPYEKKMEELNYMLGTIKSSWEFVDFIFSIEGVTRAFTHQLVRHRIGTSFAQQSQRTVDMSGFEYLTTGTIEESEELKKIYDYEMNELSFAYKNLVEQGAKPEDARGLLPTNILTNIIFKANLRTLNGMCAERLCVKAQGEFQNVMRAIRAEVLSVCEWAEPMLRVHCAATGVCCFPHFGKCSIQGMTFNPETGKRYDENKYSQSPFSDEDEIDMLPGTKEEIHQAWERLQ